MNKRLSEADVKTKVQLSFRDFYRCADCFQRGLYSTSDFYRDMKQAFYQGFWDLLASNRVELSINETNYSHFIKEYRTYRESGALCARDHSPWLYDLSDPSHEVSAEDRKQFFELMDIYRLTPEFFEPVPADIPRFSLHGIHQYHSDGVYGTDFNCVDDGGLLKDPEPVGKTFRLLNDIGLQTVITVMEDRRNSSRTGMDFDEQIMLSDKGPVVVLAEFLAEGYIEGYTAKEGRSRPEILIRLSDRGTKINWLAFWRDKNDDQSFRSFPLWQSFFHRSAELEQQREKILFSFFDSFINESPTPYTEH